MRYVEYLLAQSSSGLPKVFAAVQLDCKNDLTSGAKSYDPLTFRVTFKFMNTRAEKPQRNSMAEVSRRDAIKTLGAAALTTGLPLAGVVAAQEHATAPPARTPSVGSGAAPGAAAGSPPTTYLFFNSEEAAFIEAAVARLIPADEQWGGAIEAGVPNYIDKQ